MEVIQHRHATSDGMLLLEKELKNNSHYSFHVTVVNNVGAVPSTSIQIGKCMYTSLIKLMVITFLVTTDIQDIIISKEEDTYFIKCIYLNGSDVSGCVYILVSREEGVENVTGFIEREDSLEVTNIGCYREVLAYDNNTEFLPVNKSTNDISDICNGKQLAIKIF